MKHFHAHIAVENLETSIDFYSKLFGQYPTKRENDYAKWVLEDPSLNFAISARGHAPGVNHFGFQVDSSEELVELKKLANSASSGQVINNEEETTCCYAKSDKHWTIDPQGLAWEHFYTLSDSSEFSDEAGNQMDSCCIPLRSSEEDSQLGKEGCCVPNSAVEREGICCG